jgi:2-(1,2-epoxy-1,2-dihydrophenyl)acetyl-CoA isomerase
MLADILTTVQDGVATITFNRPPTRNSISSTMIQELTALLRVLDRRDDVRCIVFRGSGEHFCAGGDVQSFGDTLALPPLQRKHLYEQRVIASAELFELLEKLGKPVVALIRGAVAGAGLSFVLAADFALASDTAFFVFAHGKIGIALDSGLSYYLPRIIGLRKARELTLAGARLDAQEALRLNIVSRVLPDAELESEGEKLIAKLVCSATKAIGESKALLRQSFTNTMIGEVDLEAAAVGRCAATDDFKEGVAAFLENRAPQFLGR